LIHEWVGLLIIVIALAGLASTVWSIVQNAYFYECPIPSPDIPLKERVPCPSLIQRVGWQIPGLFIAVAMLLFGIWTYRKGKEGVRLISIR
jgi:hypothetical protein